MKYSFILTPAQIVQNYLYTFKNVFKAINLLKGKKMKIHC